MSLCDFLKFIIIFINSECLPVCVHMCVGPCVCVCARVCVCMRVHSSTEVRGQLLELSFSSYSGFWAYNSGCHVCRGSKALSPLATQVFFFYDKQSISHSDGKVRTKLKSKHYFFSLYECFKDLLLTGKELRKHSQLWHFLGLYTE